MVTSWLCNICNRHNSSNCQYYEPRWMAGAICSTSGSRWQKILCNKESTELPQCCMVFYWIAGTYGKIHSIFHTDVYFPKYFLQMPVMICTKFSSATFLMYSLLHIYIHAIWYECFSFQGGDFVPRSCSGRIIAGFWWMTVFILPASYTANLAALLTVTRLETGKWF